MISTRVADIVYIDIFLLIYSFAVGNIQVNDMVAL